MTNNEPEGFGALTWLVIGVTFLGILCPLLLTLLDHKDLVIK